MVHMAPHPTPCSIRPTYSMRVACGNAIISQPKMTCASLTISDTRRPNTAHAAPAGTAPITAPTPNSELAVAAAMGDTSKLTAVPFSSIVWVGDDHPSTVPMTNAPSDAAVSGNIGKQKQENKYDAARCHAPLDLKKKKSRQGARSRDSGLGRLFDCSALVF